MWPCKPGVYLCLSLLINIPGSTNGKEERKWHAMVLWLPPIDLSQNRLWRMYSVAEMQDTDLSTVMESGFFHALCFKM